MDTTSDAIKGAWISQIVRHREWIDCALSQLDGQEFFRAPAQGLNAPGAIAKHIAGSSLSRFTSLLTTDGEKPWRDRENEFDATDMTRDEVMTQIAKSWDVVINEIRSLGPDDLCKTVTIYGDPFSVAEAVERGVIHIGYHTGQLLWAVRMIKGDAFEWQTPEPGED